jgi:hypothetical protein
MLLSKKKGNSSGLVRWQQRPRQNVPVCDTGSQWGGRATYQAVHERNLGAGHERLAHALLADEAHIERPDLHGANETRAPSPTFEHATADVSMGKPPLIALRH